MEVIYQNDEVTIRKAEPEDSSVVLKYIIDLARLEKAEDKITLTAEDIEKHCMGPDALAHIWMLMVGDQLAGYCLFYNRFSTWQGKSIELEDVYVDPNFRGHGLGTKVFGLLAQRALETGCKRFEWQVYHEELPQAVKYYEKLGAHFEKGIWRCQLNTQGEIQNLVDQAKI